jgi:hypothetical protein
MSKSAVGVMVVSIMALAAWAPGQKGPEVKSAVLPPDWCHTMVDWQGHVPGQGNLAGGCPLQGDCDDPFVRDGYALDSGQLFTTIRVYLHIFREDDGSNPAAEAIDVVRQMIIMNIDFSPHKVRFVYDWQFVDDSVYRVMDQPGEINLMKQAYALDPEKQCNIYITGFGGGIGSFPWWPDALTSTGGLVVGGSYFGADLDRQAPFHVITHEMGHNLGLWHTHHGVSEVAQCSDCYETADGVNGDTTGDYCSDTPPLPSNFGLCGDPGGNDPCSGSPWGFTLPENYMSYGSGDGFSCWTMFTDQQASRMHCWIDSVLSTWVACGNGLDCNGNLIPDDCDIAEGTSADLDLNGIPDECVLLPQDLNGNGIIDVGDLLLLLGDWGFCGVCPADFDHNGTVDVADLLSLLGVWS